MSPTAPNFRAANIKQKAMTKEINIRWIACFLSNSAFDGLRLVLFVFLFAMLLLYHISETSREIKKMTAHFRVQSFESLCDYFSKGLRR